MEKQDVGEIHEKLKTSLLAHIPPLKVRKNDRNVLEVAGTKERMQGKQKVDGFYFASVVPKPKDVRLYFFPIYTHPDKFTNLSTTLRKCLKGKSCFHIKKLDDILEKEINGMISTGITVYLADDLI